MRARPHYKKRGCIVIICLVGLIFMGRDLPVHRGWGDLLCVRHVFGQVEAEQAEIKALAAPGPLELHRGKRYVLLSNMNMREEGNEGGKVISLLKEGEEFQVLDERRHDDRTSWYLIETKGGMTGWICGICEGKRMVADSQAVPEGYQPISERVLGVPKLIYVPDDYSTIGEAIKSAGFGDTVVVKPGTYNERIGIREGVSVVSYEGPDGNELVDGPGEKKVLRRALRTIIDGAGIEAPGYLVSFAKDTTAQMRLDGFTITNMPKYRSGVNLFLMEVRGCSPEVVNNILTGNRSWGGMLVSGLGIGMGPPLETVARPIVRGNVIYKNDGPGISNGPNSAALIVNNEVFDNHFPGATDKDRDAPGIGIREYARPIIEDNVCYRNGSGIGGVNLSSRDDPLIIRNNVLHHNKRAGIGLRAVGGPKTDVRVIIENNRIFGNLKAGIRLSKLDKVEAAYNMVYDNLRAGMAVLNVDRAVIEDNHVSGNLNSGIRLLNVPSVALRRNHVFYNVIAGVDFIGWQR